MEELKNLLAEILKDNLSPESWDWISGKTLPVSNEKGAGELNASFAMLPRRTSKKHLVVAGNRKQQLSVILKGFSVDEWTTDRLGRCWLLMHADPSDKQAYLAKIDHLFSGAEMNELVALYSSLPVFSYPESWVWRCTEGIRSNIGTVLEAIMYENPYPANYLGEAAWNQMVLKAFFTDKQVNRIVGLDERNNPRLASILLDYAHERWAADRSVNIQLWRLAGKYGGEEIIPDIKRLVKSTDDKEKKAAALACYENGTSACREMLNDMAELKKSIEKKELNWDLLIRE
jgi:hypothetical protein